MRLAFLPMRTIREKIDGTLNVGEHTVLLGQVDGDATIQRGCRLVVHGDVTGSVTSGVLELRGQVGGDVIGPGRLENHGQVGGSVRDDVRTSAP